MPEREIEEKGALSDENAIPLLLKTHFNRIKHLDVDKRFVHLEKSFDEKLIRLEQKFDKRFEGVDKRFEEMERRFEQIDKRFERVDGKFDTIGVKINWIFTGIIGGFTVLTFLILIIGFVK